MFNFSSKTEVNKQFKLIDLYKQMNATKEVKQNALMISSITLKNVISPTTLNVNESSIMKEFYVFEIISKKREIPSIFIKELDKVIKIQTIFIIKNDEYELLYTKYKKDKTSKYFESNWTTKKYDLPLSVNVPDSYKYIISKIFIYPYFENETVEEYISRYLKLQKLDTSIKKLEDLVNKEIQSKKRFEYNENLKQLNKEKDNLLKEV